MELPKKLVTLQHVSNHLSDKFALATLKSNGMWRQHLSSAQPEPAGSAKLTFLCPNRRSSGGGCCAVVRADTTACSLQRA